MMPFTFGMGFIQEFTAFATPGDARSRNGISRLAVLGRGNGKGGLEERDRTI